ncbi:MAG: DEAD/DEAH box helicase, partial [Gammaproteobacteria bacterium]
MNFEQLGLAEPLLQAIRKQGYESPSPIQQQAIPVILKGHDVLASAQTGTGKTGAFALPLIQRLMQKPKAKGNHT